MIFFVDNNGKIINSQPETVYQGAADTNNIYLIAPFAANLSFAVAFKLPNGVYTERYMMTQGGQLEDIEYSPTQNIFALWKMSVPSNITQYFGTVKAQFYAYATDGAITATSATSFVVSQGVPEELPATPSQDIYNQILTALSQIQSQLNNGTFAARAIYWWIDTFTYGMNEITFYPLGEYGALIRSVATNNEGNAPYDDEGNLNSEYWQELVDFNKVLNAIEEAAQSAAEAAQSATESAQSAAQSAASASAAATSEQNAAQSAQNAATSESNAAQSAEDAEQSAQDAAQSAQQAESSATDAAQSAVDAAESAQEVIDYLGKTIVFVTELPEVGDPSLLYFVTGESDNLFSIYVYKNGEWKLMGESNLVINDTNAVHFTQQTLTSEQQSQARTNIGAAAQSTANGGFAGGSGASATNGAAIGNNAQATADGAVQLGAGTNSTPDTLQFHNFTLCDASGQIPAERLNNVPSKITGGASAIATANLSSNRALVSNASGKVAVSSITATELSYLDGAKSNIQQQIDNLGSGTIVKTAEEWASDNTVLAAGVLGYDSTGKITKIGDGTNAWANLPLFITSDTNFATLSWHIINQLSQEGFADKYFSVGEEKTINLTTGEEVTLVILGFNHDELTGGGKAGMTIGMKNLLATRYRMNDTNTNVGGWDESEMRTSTMATLLSQLPSDLQAVIKQVNKKATAGGNSNSITTSADKLWLLAEVEVDGTTKAGYADEGEQYEYWKTVKDGTVAADRIKYLSNGSGSARTWWLRSPYVDQSENFRACYHTGEVNVEISNYMQGVSFGFCV